MIEIKGLQELRKKLESLSKTEAKAAIRKGSRAGAKIIAAEARADAPRDTGRLESAIKVRALKRSRRWIGAAVTLAVPYGAFEEFGLTHRKLEGKHFIEQASNTRGDEAIEQAIQIMAQEIERSMAK